MGREITHDVTKGNEMMMATDRQQRYTYAVTDNALCAERQTDRMKSRSVGPRIWFKVVTNASPSVNRTMGERTSRRSPSSAADPPFTQTWPHPNPYSPPQRISNRGQARCRTPIGRRMHAPDPNTALRVICARARIQWMRMEPVLSVHHPRRVHRIATATRRGSCDGCLGAILVEVVLSSEGTERIGL